MHTCFITPSRAVISVRMVLVMIKLNIALFYSKGAECKSRVPLNTASITLKRNEFETELQIKISLIEKLLFRFTLYFWIFERLNAFPHLQSRDESVKDLVGGFSFTKTFRCREEKNRKDIEIDTSEKDEGLKMICIQILKKNKHSVFTMTIKSFSYFSFSLFFLFVLFIYLSISLSSVLF